MRIVKLSEDAPVEPIIGPAEAPKVEPDWTTVRHKDWKGARVWEVFYKKQSVGFGFGKEEAEAIKFVQQTHPELPR